MASLQSFLPAYASGATVAPSTSSGSSEKGKGNQSILLTNLGSVVVYVRVGDSTVTATTADYPVLANSQVSISKGSNDSHVAYITASGTGSLHIMAGEGI